MQLHRVPKTGHLPLLSLELCLSFPEKRLSLNTYIHVCLNSFQTSSHEIIKVSYNVKVNSSESKKKNTKYFKIFPCLRKNTSNFNDNYLELDIILNLWLLRLHNSGFRSDTEKYLYFIQIVLH